MKIRLYKTFVKRINSTLQPPNTMLYTQKEVYLKEDTSIIRPIFLLTEYDAAYNYIYVPDWGRYYFINDVNLGLKGFWEVQCTFDHLASYKDSIGAYTCFVERTSDSTKYDTAIADSAISAKEKVIYSSSASTSVFGAGGGVIVCRTLNINHGITTYYGAMSNFADLFEPISDDPNILATIEGILKYYLCNPSAYVIDCYFLAVPLSAMSGSPDIVSSGWYSAGGAYRWTSNSPVISNTITLNKPNSYYNDFREADKAFSAYMIYIPSVGEVPLSGDLIDTTLTMKYCIDINTGEASFILKSNGDQVATYHGNLKSPMMTGSMMPNGGALITSVANGSVAAVAGGAVGMGASILNVAQNIINPTPSINGSQGSAASFANQPDIVITCIAKESAASPVTIGKPCCKNLQLNTVSGYIQTAGASIDNIAGTDIDKKLINDSLDRGFYYE